MLYACLTCLALIGLLAVTGSAPAQETKGENPVVVLETNKGNITIELYRREGPR